MQGLGAPILIGLLVGFVAARIMRFRAGPFGNVGLGVVSLLLASAILRLLQLPARGPLLLAVLSLGIACGLIWLLQRARR